MKKLLILVVILYLLPSAFAELEIVETGFNITIFSGALLYGGNETNDTTTTGGYIYIETEDENFNYSFNQNTTKIEKIRLIKDIETKCQTDKYNELCYNITSTFDKISMMYHNNLNYQEERDNCIAAHQSDVDTREIFENLYKGMNASFLQCESEKNGLKNDVDSCNNRVSAMLTRQKCDEEIKKNKGIDTTTFLFIIGGMIGIWVLNERKKKTRTPPDMFGEEKPSLRSFMRR